MINKREGEHIIIEERTSKKFDRDCVFERVDSHDSLRAYKLEIHDNVAFTNLPVQVEYVKQSNIRVGDLLYVLKDQAKVYHSSLEEKQIENHSFLQITNVIYKNWFVRILKRFFKEPIQAIQAEYIFIK